MTQITEIIFEYDSQLHDGCIVSHTIPHRYLYDNKCCIVLDSPNIYILFCRLNVTIMKLECMWMILAFVLIRRDNKTRRKTVCPVCDDD